MSAREQLRHIIGGCVTSASIRKCLIDTHPDKQPPGTPADTVKARRDLFEQIIRLRHDLLADNVKVPGPHQTIVSVPFLTLETGGPVTATVCVNGTFVEVTVEIVPFTVLPALGVASNGLPVILVDEIETFDVGVQAARRIANTYDLSVRWPLRTVDDLVNGADGILVGSSAFAIAGDPGSELIEIDIPPYALCWEALPGERGAVKIAGAGIKMRPAESAHASTTSANLGPGRGDLYVIVTNPNNVALGPNTIVPYAHSDVTAMEARIAILQAELAAML